MLSGHDYVGQGTSAEEQMKINPIDPREIVYD